MVGFPFGDAWEFNSLHFHCIHDLIAKQYYKARYVNPPIPFLIVQHSYLALDSWSLVICDAEINNNYASVYGYYYNVLLI